MPNDLTEFSTDTVYVPPLDVREVLQEMDNKDYEDEFHEQLNDEQREVMEDIWLKADEMGKCTLYH